MTRLPAGRSGDIRTRRTGSTQPTPNTSTNASAPSSSALPPMTRREPAPISAERRLSDRLNQTDLAPRSQTVETIDKSPLLFPEPRRVRDREHVRHVAQQSCLVCGRKPCDAHHLRFAQSRALGRKVSDEFTVPLCRGHHRELHRHGDEAAWWRKAAIDPSAAARSLWLETHPLSGNSEMSPVSSPQL